MKKAEFKEYLDIFLESLSDDDDIEVSSTMEVKSIKNEQTGRIEKLVPSSESQFSVTVRSGKDSFDGFMEEISKNNTTELCGHLSIEDVDTLLKE